MTQTERLEKIIKHQTTKAYAEENKRIAKLLDEALTHAELVISEYDSQRKDEAQKAKQEEINKAANEAAKAEAAKKKTTAKK